MKKPKLTNLRELSIEEQTLLNGGLNMTGCSCKCSCDSDKVSSTKSEVADGVKKRLEKK